MPPNYQMNAFEIAKRYCIEKGYEVTNFSLYQYCPDKVTLFVAENADEVENVVVHKISDTQYILWAYGNFEQKFTTSYNYATVYNTCNCPNDYPL